MRAIALGDLSGLGWNGKSALAYRMTAPWVGPARLKRTVAVPWAPRIPARFVPREVSTLFQPNGLLDIRGCGQPGAPPCDEGGVDTSIQTGLGGLGRWFPAFCNTVRIQLDELKLLLDAEGFKRLPEATRLSAKAAYNDINGKAAYIGFDSGDGDCSRDTRELQAIVKEVRAQMGANAPPPIRPEVASLAPTESTLGVVKLVAITAAVVAGAYLLTPIIKTAMRGW